MPSTQTRSTVVNQPDSPARSLRSVLALAALLAASLDLIVTWQLKHTTDPLNYRLLAFAAIYYLLERGARTLRWESSPTAILCGCFLLASAVAKARVITVGDDYYHFFPLILGVGLGLLAFGARDLLRFWRVLVILLTVSLFDNPFSSLTISHLRLDVVGAWISANMLLLLGYPAVAQSNLVLLPSGMVEVAGGCSSAQPLLYLLKLTLLALFVFPTRPWQKLFLVCSAVAIALLGNAVRIAVMAVLATAGDTVRFDYWHDGTGSALFSTLYLALFCVVCAICMRIGRREGERPSPAQVT